MVDWELGKTRMMMERWNVIGWGSGRIGCVEKTLLNVYYVEFAKH
jgi:hypothetical protein